MRPLQTGREREGVPTAFDQRRLEADPASSLEEAIRAYVAGSPRNRLAGEVDEPLFDGPLVGFARGDDPLFEEFKSERVIGAYHLTPAEALPVYLERQGREERPEKPGRLTVVAAVFPFTESIKRSNLGETLIGSVKWNMAHHDGAPFVEECMEAVAGLLRRYGHVSVAPSYTKPLVEFMVDGLPVTDWSEKHVAYAAGLGTLSINGGLITPLGKAVWCGSLITELLVPPTPRMYEGPDAYCLFSKGGSCRRCAVRCPSGAISEQGFDAAKCFHYNAEGLRELIERRGLQGYPEDHVICGLCETMVPCERRIPRATGRRRTG